MSDANLTAAMQALAGQLAVVLDDISALRERETAIKAAMRKLVSDELGDYQAGNVTVRLQANRRLDETRALAMCPEQLRGLVTYPETRIDRDKLKALAPEVYEAAMTYGAPKVGLR